MKPLIYTFRTCEIGKAIGESVFVLDKLRHDITKLEDRIRREQPAWVIGIGNGATTRYEPLAVNQFQKRKQIVSDGPAQYRLFVPETTLPIARTPTVSFCNWSAYRLAHVIAEYALPTQLTFLHVALPTAEQITQELGMV